MKKIIFLIIGMIFILSSIVGGIKEPILDSSTDSKVINIQTTKSNDKYIFDLKDIKSKAEYIKLDDSLLLTNELDETIKVKYINNENDGIIEYIKNLFTSYESTIELDKITKDVSADVQLQTFKKVINGITAMEYQLELSKKPDNNIFYYDLIGYENYNFYYQGPLNLEVGNLSCSPTECGDKHRPENVVGSYAVYYKDKAKKDNEYKTGKAFHIFRPYIYDANGDSVWGELNYNNGQLTVTVDQSWLDNAIYPVIVDPTFGYTSAGATAQSFSLDGVNKPLILSFGYNITETGIITDMHYYGYLLAATGDIRMGIYSKGTGSNYDYESIYTETLDETTTYINLVGTKGWNNFNMSSASNEITAGTYGLAIQGSGARIPTYNPISLYTYYDNVASSVSEKKYYMYTAGADTSLPAFQDPISLDILDDDDRYSVYATYSIPADTTAPTFSHVLQNITVGYNTDFSYDINATDDTAVDCFTVNNTNFDINCTGFLNWSSIDFGMYVLNISVNDTSGNIAWEEMWVDAVNTVPTTPTDLSADDGKKVTEVITASCSDSTDVNGDSITYYYEFYNTNSSSTIQAYSTTATYTVQVSDAHDELRVRCKAYDGTGYSGEDTELVNIADTLPTVPTTDSLTPNGPYINDTLIGICSGSTDADGDSITYHYRFYDITDANERQAFSVDDTYTLSAPGDSHDQFRLDCRAITSGGNSATDRTGTDTETILNSAPTTPTNLSADDSKKVTEVITASCSDSTDIDLDAITYYYEFYNTNSSSTIQAYSTTATYTVQVSDAHDELQVRCKAYDGTGYSGEDTVLVNIADTLPTVPTTDGLTPNGPDITDTLTGTCSGSTDADGDSITYHYRFYDITDANERQAFSVDDTYTLSAPGDSHDQFRLDCRAITSGGNSATDRTGTDLETVVNTVPTTPTDLSADNNKLVGETITASCSDSTDIDLDAITYYYEFYNNDDAGIVQVYSTTSTYVVQGTDSGNELRVRCKAYDGYDYSAGEDTALVDVLNVGPTFNHTLSNFTINSDSYFEYQINASDDESIVCFTVNNINFDINCTGYLNATNLPAGTYNLIITINDTLGLENSSSMSVTSVDRFTSLTDDSSLTYPEIGDILSMSIDVFDQDTVDVCQLQLNDTGVWLNKSSYPVSAITDTVNMVYTIQTYSTSINKSIAWRVWCNDTLSNIYISIEQDVTVIDITPSEITINELPISASNNTIISSLLYDIPYNVTFSDTNLFQSSVNVTCDINGTIHYWEELDHNVTSYTRDFIIDLEGMLPQKCTFEISASDDHTTAEIPDYEIIKHDDGIEYDTGIDKIKIENNNFDSVKTKKNKDRYTFDFDLKDKKLVEEFTIKSENKLYPRYGNYRGHLVAWDERTKTGNWIDFELDTELDLEYTMTKINDYEYNIKIESKISKNKELKQKRKSILGVPVGDYMTDEELKLDTYGLDKLSFKSLGGTNVFVLSYDFYIGGTLNVTGINIVDNSSIMNWTASITSLDAFPVVSKTVTVNGSTAYLTNLSNGSYSIEFYHPWYFNQTYLEDVTGIVEDMDYSSYQSILNINLINQLTELPLTDFNITLNKIGATYIQYNDSIFYLNASEYNIVASSPELTDREENYTTIYRTSHTLDMSLPIIASFVLLDEYTLNAFNISGTNSITFVALCPSETQQTVINSSNYSIEISCQFDKFRFIIDYGSASYYRTFILPYDELTNAKIYLIDLTTTQSLYNSFIIDDLLQKYDNPSIYIKKFIGGTNQLITSDYADIENKIGAYLIENHEYTVEVHSENLPTLVLGSYSADIAGNKALSLYDVSIYPDNDDNFENDVSWNMGTINQSETTYARFRYEDIKNKTDSVTFYLWEDTYNGTLITSYTAIDEYDIVWVYNITGYNTSTIVGGIEITHPEVDIPSVSKVLQIYERISLGIESYLSTGFLDWFFTILLGGIALMATIKTSNYMSMVLIGLAGLFVLFGWFGLSSSVLAFAALIALISFIRDGANPK